MKFQLPQNLQAEVKRYDPNVRAAEQLREDLERQLREPRKTARAPRVYRRGNPAGMIPLDCLSVDEDQAREYLQEKIKEWKPPQDSL